MPPPPPPQHSAASKTPYVIIVAALSIFSAAAAAAVFLPATSGAAYPITPTGTLATVPAGDVTAASSAAATSASAAAATQQIKPTNNQQRGPMAPTHMGFTGKQIDGFFGGKNPPKAWLDAVTTNPSEAIKSWQATLDDPECFSTSKGWNGPYAALLGNSNLEEFTLNLEKSSGKKLSAEWRRAFAAEFGHRVLGPDGTPASSDGSRSWGMGYTFHLVRNRWADESRLGKDGIKLTWPGGFSGGGTRAMNSLVRKWCAVPSVAGATEVTIKVDAAWLEKQPKAVKRLSATSVSVPAGLFIAWDSSRWSFHGAWDGLCWIRKLYESNGESVFVEISAAERKLFGAAMRNLASLVRSGADDRSGYNPSEMAEWRKSCGQELSSAGVQVVMKW